MSFRVRTALVVMALTAITMGGAFAVVWERFVASQRDQLDDALLLVARREAAEAAAGQLEFTDAPGPSANAVGPLPKYGVIYGTNGAVLAQTDNFRTVPMMPRARPLERAFDFDHDGQPMRGVVVAVDNTGRRVFLATTRADFEDDKGILARAMAVVFFFGCGWAAVVAFVVASRLTREHRVVADVARRVASGDTSARVMFATRDGDLRVLASDLNAMIEQLVGLLAAQERFIAHAAHELRTPMTSLRVELELALRTAQGRDDYEVAVRGALDSARRLTDLSEDLLQLARVKAVPSSEGDASLGEALEDAIADVEPAGRARGVFIVAPPLSVRVNGDRRGLARLFRNLLENAVRFSPDGGKVLVEGDIDPDRVVVRVVDSGPGVAANLGDRVFEPFVRGNLHDDAGGTGLGLAIARGLARAFGGEIRVELREGEGGRFVVELRRARVGEAGEPAAPREREGALDQRVFAGR